MTGAGTATGGMQLRMGRKELVGFLALVTMMNAFAIDAFLPGFPEMRESFGLDSDSTLLGRTVSLFLVGNAGRSVAVGAAGDLDATTLTLFAAGMPVVFAFTALGRRFPPSLSDRNMRRLSSALVVAVGGFVGGTAVLRLVA